MLQDNFDMDKGGVKADGEKIALDLLPIDVLTSVAKLYTQGAQKYTKEVEIPIEKYFDFIKEELFKYPVIAKKEVAEFLSDSFSRVENSNAPLETMKITIDELKRRYPETKFLQQETLVKYNKNSETITVLKSGRRNWEKGWRYGRTYAALLRHLFLWWSGEECDKEPPHAHHLDAVIFNAMALRAFTLRGTGEDDRPSMSKLEMTMKENNQPIIEEDKLKPYPLCFSGGYLIDTDGNLVMVYQPNIATKIIKGLKVIPNHNCVMCEVDANESTFMTPAQRRKIVYSIEVGFSVGVIFEKDNYEGIVKTIEPFCKQPQTGELTTRFEVEIKHKNGNKYVNSFYYILDKDEWCYGLGLLPITDIYEEFIEELKKLK